MTEGTAMAPWNGPNNSGSFLQCFSGSVLGSGKEVGPLKIFTSIPRLF